MKKLYTLLLAVSVGGALNAQVIFQSDLSSWTAGDPDGWMGAATHTVDLAVTEVTFGATYGTSMAQLITTGSAHRRFSTQALTVVPGNSYEIKIWCAGAQGELRTGYYYNNGSAVYTPYNPYIDVFATTGGNLTMLSQIVNVPSAATTSGEFIISVINTDNLVGIVIDSVSISEVAPPPANIVSIYDIQYTTDVSGDSPENGNIVTTYGIVTGVIGFGADADRFFIQDGDGAWNGIYVYENGYTVALGDSVEVTGTVTEYFGLTEITSVTDVTIINSGNAQPNAAVVTTLASAEEQYECVLVQVTDAECTNADAGFGQWTVNDGSGNRLIDDQIYSYTPLAGNYYNVTGVTFLSFSEVKIYPRISADIEVTGFAGIQENSLGQIYPNPTNQFVNINIDANANFVIYNINGEQVYSGFGNEIVDVTNFASGIYSIQVSKENTVETYRLIVK